MMLPKIDAKATAAATSDLLKHDYPHLRNVAGRPSVLQGQRLDGMPHATDPLAGEHVLVEGVDATQFVVDCQTTLLHVRAEAGDACYNLLLWLYFKPLPTAMDVMERIGLEHSAFYEKRRRALCTFAEAFPDTWGELLVYKKGGDEHENS